MARIWEYSQTSEVVIAILASIILYAFRTKLKIIYGLIEVVAGLYLLYLSTHTSTGSGLSTALSSDFGTLHFTVVTTSYLGAIFLMVRGYDTLYSTIPAVRWRFWSRQAAVATVTVRLEPDASA